MPARPSAKWTSVLLLTAAAAAPWACTSGGFTDERTSPAPPRHDARADPASLGLSAEETGEVVRLRWPRDAGFRTTHPNADSARSARVEVQHSTTGRWEGEHTVLTQQMCQRGALSMWNYYSEGAETSVPPLEQQEHYGLEEFIHHAPVVGANHYRVREIEWDRGRIARTGDWSRTASVTYTGAHTPRLAPRLPDYDPGELPALIISQMVGNSASAETAVPVASVAARQRSGPAVWQLRFAHLQNAKGVRSTSGAIGWCIKDLGVRKVVLDDGRSPGTSRRPRVASLPRPTGAYPSWDPPPYAGSGAFADDATMSLPDLWWRSLELAGQGAALRAPSPADARKLGAFVEEYHRWDDGLAGPKFVYCGCPFTEDGSFETEVLAEKSHMRPILAESHILIMGTTASAAITDEATGTPTATARFIRWWHDAYPGRWVFVEPGLRRRRCRQWMEPNDFPFVGSWQTIDNLFDQDTLAKQRRLELRTSSRGDDDDALDPRDYPDRRHIVFVGPNVCPYVADAESDTERVQRMIEVAAMLYAFDPALIVQLGDLGLLEAMRPDQAATLVRLAERAAAAG